MKNIHVFDQVLNELEQGILVFKEDGQLFFGNRIACQLLTLSLKHDTGKKYSELFLAEIPNTALNQIIHKTLQQKQNIRQQAVPYRTLDGKTVGLSISTRFVPAVNFATTGPAEAGVIVCLRETGKAAPGSGEEKLMNLKYEQLEQAYLNTEERNRELKRSLKRIEWLKIVLTVMLFFMFGVIIFYTRYNIILPKAKLPAFTEGISKDQIVKVIRDTLSKKIILSGSIEPHRKITLAAQSKGKVIRKIFSEGDIVEKDQILYELDRKEISKKVRSARVSYMELLEKYDRLKNWETSLEVMQAKRKFDLSKIALSDEKKKLQETRKLLKKGIIPRIEYEQAQTAFKRLDYDFQNARQSLEQIQAKGNPDKLEVLRLQLFNAREELDELERNYEGAFVRAPVTGVVMRPVAGDGNIRMFKNEGDLVSAGDLMATIGATDSYIIASVVGEYAVNHLHVAQAVKISSFALPGITLPGEVQWVATQAKQNQGMHYFPVRLVIPTVPDSVRRALRLGALAEVEIVVREMPDVLTLPIEAVFRYQGGNQVYIIDSTGQQQLKTVTTGYSDNKKIIIKSGLVEGEEVFIPREVK